MLWTSNPPAISAITAITAHPDSTGKHGDAKNSDLAGVWFPAVFIYEIIEVPEQKGQLPRPTANALEVGACKSSD